MRSVLLGLVLLALGAAPAQAAYDHASGGLASPASLISGGQADYSVSLTGRPAVVDVVLVLDTSGSMATALPPSGSRWDAVAQASTSFVTAFNSNGFFDRGGRVGVVTFSDTAATAAAPSAGSGPAVTGIASSSPAGSGCISCGLQLATDLLTAIPGAGSHRQIVYLIADGADTGDAGALTTAIAASNAAHVERRIIGVGPGAVSAGLEGVDSDGIVPNAASLSDLVADYGAQPTALPGATNLSWTFRVTPGFTVSSPSASVGSVAVAGQDVTWTIASLGAETATLSLHATHAVASGCAATSLLTGTAFSDADGDATPSVGLAPLTVTGCASSPPPVAPITPTPIAKAVSSIKASAVQHGSKVKATAKIGVARSSVHVRLVRRTSKKAKPQTLGTATDSSAAAGSDSLSVKLNATGKALLRKYHTLKLQLEITVTPPNGQGVAITLTKTITLKQ